MTDFVDRMQDFMENEARSCSMDFGRVDAKYVQRMLGGAYTLEDIEAALKVAKKGFGL